MHPPESSKISKKSLLGVSEILILLAGRGGGGHFLKQLASPVSAAMLQLKFPGMKFFSSILGIETFFS